MTDFSDKLFVVLTIVDSINFVLLRQNWRPCLSIIVRSVVNILLDRLTILFFIETLSFGYGVHSLNNNTDDQLLCVTIAEVRKYRCELHKWLSFILQI